MGRIRSGIGGWVFAPWRDNFYPKGLAQARELNYASRHVTAIEINGTFYGSQKPATFRKWHDEAPDDFVFSIKAPRIATHRKDLNEAASSVQRFLESGITELADKLGPILWQFAPTKQFNPDEMAAFLSFLPDAIDGRPLRHVLEARHGTFLVPEFIDLARKHKVAICLVDSADHPMIPDVTADFVYARLRRTEPDQPMGYTPKGIAKWVERFKTWADGGEPDDLERIHPKKAPKKKRDCFAYFIAGAKERNPAAAQAFLDKLK